ncbi:MAG: cupin domain-containing protein [Sulfitobacter sp.]|nr:cupin domain-containing protein [Sulfitobacter sp.]
MKDQFDINGATEWQGTYYRTLLSAQDSDGSLSITDSLSPAGSGPPRHIHKDADETFVTLSGEAVFWRDGSFFQSGPGESVFIPRGVPHTFRVTDAGPSRHLVIMTPGGFEGFFHEMGQAGYAIPEDMQKIVEVAQRYNLEFTGPPLDATD